MRPTLYGNRQAVSAGHYLAASAASAILDAGGNAVDAGCCAGIALAVLHPDEVNFAGVAPIMIRLATGRTVTIAGLGHWPRSIPPDLFMREHNGTMPVGVLRTVVPAAPDAWITALRDHGTMSFGEVAASAVELARDGFAVFEFLHNEIVKHEDDYRLWPSNTEIFLPNGRPPAIGERFIQRDLAATIQFMIDEEKAHASKGRKAGLEAARAAFYKGDIAARIVAFHKEQGGYLSREDMADFHCHYEEPLRTRWRDFDVVTCGPWCQGPALAQALLMIERAGLQDLAHNSVDYIHILTEAFKGALADREHHYGDPRFVDTQIDKLLSADHVAARVRAIDPKRAYPEMPAPILPHSGPISHRPSSGPLPDRDPDTSYVCVVDRWGNAFSATPSDGSWRSPVIPGLGIVPSPRGTQSRPDPRHPSGVAPGKRPRLTPNPAIAVRDDGSVVPFGAPGGDSQIQGMLQVFLNVFHFGMDVQEAIEAPRFVSLSFPSSFAPYDYFPGRLAIEQRFSSTITDELARRGHEIFPLPDYSRRVSSVEMIVKDASGGFLRAGADPREPAYAIVT